MKLTDLALGDGDNLDGAEAELLVEAGDMLLVAREAVERLGDDDVEAAGAGVGEELLVAGAEMVGAAQRMVGIGADDGPALRRDPGGAEADLVLDRGLALVLGRVAGIDGGAHGETPISGTMPVGGVA